jgi:hypothetical protein
MSGNGVTQALQQNGRAQPMLNFQIEATFCEVIFGEHQQAAFQISARIRCRAD